MKRVHLELGGKAPMIVLDDADPATVAEAIKIGGLLELRPGLHGVVAHHRQRVRVYDDVVSATKGVIEAMKVG